MESPETLETRRVILKLMDSMGKRGEFMTPTEAMEKAVRNIRAHKGVAIERAVYGAIGAATAFERIGAFSLEEGADWCQAARDEGDAQRKRLAHRSLDR